MPDKPEEKEEPVEPVEKEGEEKEVVAEEKPAAPAAPAKPAKKPMPAWMSLVAVAFFIGLAAGVGYVIWLLVNTFNLVKDDVAATRAGTGRVVERLQQEDVLGRGSELLIDKKPGKPARIRFLLRDANRQPITSAVVDIVVIRPGDPTTPPVRAKLQMLEPGVYRGEVDLKQAGRWEAQILVQEGKNSYQVTQPIILPETEPEPATEPEKKPQ
jgi:nitrogen fixation protein FixH